MTRTTAVEFARDHVRVNTILPGLMKTADGRTFRRPCGELCQGRRRGDVAARDAQVRWVTWATPGTSPTPRCFFASDESKYVTGLELVVDGGVTLKAG